MTKEEKLKKLAEIISINGKFDIDMLSDLVDYMNEYAEAYHKSKVDAISDETKRAIKEFETYKNKYPRVATVDVINMLKRLLSDLKLKE